MNNRVLVIGDLHVPYQHPDAFQFLKAIKKKFKPDKVIDIGDECDFHALSYHDSDPDLMSAGHELKSAREYMKQLEKLFPKMDLIHSNHGSLYYRKAKTNGVPQAALLPYNDLLGVGNGWKWHPELTIKLSNGQKCYFHHGRNANVVKVSQMYGMSAVQGHYHEKFLIEYWANSEGLYFAAQTACLVDDDSFAMAYNNTNLKRPIIGSLMIINGHPLLVPMVLNKKGRWVGYID